jgi:multidrug efflux pump subunit AcrA (membrane-fusion protein)
MADTSAESSAQSFAVAGSPGKPAIDGKLMFNVIVPLALLTLAAGFILLMGKVEPESRRVDDTTRVGRLRSLPIVEVERLHEIDVNVTPLRLSVDGTVVPFREARVAAEVAGQVIYKSELCEAGNFVKQGQVLMRIDPTDYELEVQRLSRLKQQEYQALAEIDQELKNTQRSLEVAKQDVALQQAEVDRQSALPPGFASRGEIDRAKRSLLQATQGLVNYENGLDLLKKRRERLESSEQLAATQLKVAEVNLARTEIKAPIDGVIAAENADLNTFVARGNTLVTIEDTSKVEVATNLRMDQLYWVLDQAEQTSSGKADVAAGYELPVTPAVIEYELNGRESAFYRWQGRLLGYDGIGLDPNTRTVPVRVIVDNPREFLDEKGEKCEAVGPNALVRGMYVRVNLMIKPRTPLVVIPARALRPGNRVWQFERDDSVLGAPPAAPIDTDDQVAETQTQADTNQQVDSTTGSNSEQADSFDPQQWVAGRVLVRKSIFPVDSLYLDDGDAAPVTQQGRQGGPDRMWVCEVRDQQLTGTSFVVTSPLAAVADDGLAARADVKMINLSEQSQIIAAREPASVIEESRQ